MEKKPIKRNENISKLSKDHHFTLLFCWKIRQGLKFEVEPGEIKDYIQYFWRQFMQPHFAEEETILFAQIKNAEVQRALNEHKQIAEQIKALDNNTHNSTEQISMLAEMVDNHVRYEERQLFPHLEKILTAEQLDNIGRQLAVHHNPELKDDFANEFWLRKKAS
jgi:hemerythrin-like domain-containing protein